MDDQQFDRGGLGAQDTAPLSLGQYIIMFLISAIPIVNIIMLLIWAFSANININKKNFARASLIFMVAGIILAILFSSVLAAMFAGMAGGLPEQAY